MSGNNNAAMAACWRQRLTAVAQVAVVVLRLVVHPHVVGDVGGRQQLPTDVTRHLLLVADEVGAEAVPRGKGRRARLNGRGERPEGSRRLLARVEVGWEESEQ